jgi:hypothetical protein
LVSFNTSIYSKKNIDRSSSCKNNIFEKGGEVYRSEGVYKSFTRLMKDIIRSAA